MTREKNINVKWIHELLIWYSANKQKETTHEFVELFIHWFTLVWLEHPPDSSKGLKNNWLSRSDALLTWNMLKNLCWSSKFILYFQYHHCMLITCSSQLVFQVMEPRTIVCKATPIIIPIHTPCQINEAYLF